MSDEAPDISCVVIKDGSLALSVSYLDDKCLYCSRDPCRASRLLSASACCAGQPGRRHLSAGIAALSLSVDHSSASYMLYR
eukprot:6191480-Pleurochrysis_carterae.AAC.1